MVYECELSLDGQTQHAAAKVLSMLEDVNSASPGTAASGASSLLQHEAEMLQGLSDVGGVARLVGQLDGGRVLLLQPVGESLAALTDWEAMEAVRLHQAMLGLVRTVRAAHDRSIVHRDLRPSNLLVVKSSSTGHTELHIIDWWVG